MSLWKRIASRLRGTEPPAREPDVGMTYADLERDKPRKEAQLSGAGPREPGGEAPARRDPDGPETRR